MADNNSIVNPNKSLEIPEWVNQEYFREVLQKDEPNHVEVLKFTAVAAIPPGGNFTSAMLRIHMELAINDGSKKQKSYVLKTMLPDEKGGKMIKEVGIFDKELKMYQKYLPAFEALYKAAGADIQLAPKCLQAEELEECINFIFEDLAEQNFKNVDRVKGLDEAHMKSSLHKLAEFHAAAAVYSEQNGPFPEEFNEGFASKKFQSIQDQAFKLQREPFVKSMDIWGLNNAEEYKQNFVSQKNSIISPFNNIFFLKVTAEQLTNMCLRNLEIDTNDFNTLTHGDLWSSNLLFKYKPDGTIDRPMLVDFQLCKCGSPAQDLLFLITISAAKDVRINEFDKLVRIYWTRLIECLKLLKYQKKLPTLSELQMSMYKGNNTFYAFMAIFNHLPTILFPNDEKTNHLDGMEETKKGEQFRDKLYSNPLFANAMSEIYPFFYNRGIFNFKDFE
ncbi:hypothetical protein KR222_005482 [Zaprionus bogoriensis]|nr:hypothetical protein KR222_005482 [Zaprionus bogoriensis]